MKSGLCPVDFLVTQRRRTSYLEADETRGVAARLARRHGRARGAHGVVSGKGGGRGGRRDLNKKDKK